MKSTIASLTLTLALAAGAEAGTAAVWAVNDGEKVEQDDLAHPAKARNSAWDGRTVRLFVVCSAVALSLPLAVHFGPLAHALQLAPLDAWEWVRALLLALAAIAWRRFVR